MTASVGGVRVPASFTLTNAYKVATGYDQTKVRNDGGNVAVQFQLLNGLGQDMGSPSLPVTAVGLTRSDGSSLEISSPGNSQPGNLFSYDPTEGTYQCNLKTSKSYTSGTYTLKFRVCNDPTVYGVKFVIG